MNSRATSRDSTISEVRWCVFEQYKQEVKEWFMDPEDEDQSLEAGDHAKAFEAAQVRLDDLPPARCQSREEGNWPN